MEEIYDTVWFYTTARLASVFDEHRFCYQISQLTQPTDVIGGIGEMAIKDFTECNNTTK